MALTSKVVDEKIEVENKNNGLWVSIPKDSNVTISPLVNFDDITVYQQYKFGDGKQYWTLPDMQTDNDPGRMMGFVPEKGYIMPVLLFDSELDAWLPEPKYYRFTKSVLAGLRAENENIANYAKEESEPNFTFKHSIIKVIRDDTTKKGFTQYVVSWTARHLSKNKTMKNNLPESELDMNKGILPFSVENSDDENEIRKGIIEFLSKKSDFMVDGKTIGERMKDAGLLSEESEFEMA